MFTSVFAVQVSTHSRLKAAALIDRPNGGGKIVSTHSRLKAADTESCTGRCGMRFQHTAA